MLRSTTNRAQQGLQKYLDQQNNITFEQDELIMKALILDAVSINDMSNLQNYLDSQAHINQEQINNIISLANFVNSTLK